MALELNKPTYTEVSETFRPQRGRNHPVTNQEFVKGGLQSFSSLAERNDFPKERRKKFMVAVVNDVSYLLLENLVTWVPFDRGYLVLNPKKNEEKFYVVFNFRYIILSVTAIDATVVQGFQNGNPNIKQTLILSGAEGSVVTFEIARIYVDQLP
jgi:hypothetical protein